MINSTQRAKTLRKTQTDAEKLLWQRLRNRQVCDAKFRRQYVIGKYIVDFVCIKHGLILEVDGGHHTEQQEYDNCRTRFLEQQGFQVIRFWNNDVLIETDAVFEIIRKALLDNPSPQPSPLEGEREYEGGT